MDTEYGEQLRSMLVFDALIYNEDRHFGNFGFLRDNYTGKLTGPAPIFDNGLFLLCFAGKEELAAPAALAAYAKTRTNPYHISFEEGCAGGMRPKQKAQLRRMVGFTFQRHPGLNLPEKHLNALERLLEVRTRQLLAIPNRTKTPQTKVRKPTEIKNNQL